MSGQQARKLQVSAEADHHRLRAAPLIGRQFLYVGGIGRQLPKLRSLTESYGAELLHHDGGLQESIHSLASMIAKADAVVFPVGCISHPAMWTIKRICEKNGTTYFPLRSIGLASLSLLLERLQTEPAPLG
jgi:hypothetical protein